jgi:uncharacterized OB-fold protein
MAEQTEMTPQRPLPEITPLTEPFWTAAQSKKLVVQRCAKCDKYQFPPELACTHCGSPDIGWQQVSGRATLYSWTVAHPPMLPYFQERSPWPVVAVELEEGPRMIAGIVDTPVDEYVFGMSLVAAFEKISEDVTLVMFRKDA